MFTADGCSNRFNSCNDYSENRVDKQKQDFLLDLEVLARKNMDFRERTDLSLENRLELGVNGFGVKPNHENLKGKQESEFLDGGLGLKLLKFGSGGSVDEETCVKVEKMGNLSSQELTLSYMCDNLKMGSLDKENTFWSMEESRSGFAKGKYKGKEVITDFSNEKGGSDDCSGRWVERDFFQLRSDDGGAGGGNKRLKRETSACEDEIEEGLKIEKKSKLETLNLSLALPDVSLTIAPSNPSNVDDPPVTLPKRTRSIQSLGLSNNNTRASSDDFAASLSYSYSHPFSHNPSCSLNPNSTENYDYSVGSHPGSRRDDQIWYCGEGTNGSVHSRFKPIGDVPLLQRLQSVASDGDKAAQFVAPGTNSEHDPIVNKKIEGISFSRHSYPMMNGQSNCSERSSFFPSELPARPRKDTQSMDSRERPPEQHKISENGGSAGVVHRNWNQIDGGQPQPRVLSRPERILHEIVSESIPVVAQVLQELPSGLLEAAKDYLKNLMGTPEKREEFAGLQRRLGRRSDLTFETLSKCYKSQLDILVALKTGILNYLSGKNRLPTAELIEIFLFSRCRNMNCKNFIPVDDCDCKICASKKGFCSDCMCQICFNFDCSSNTCSWVGCDVCSHWCHAVCGIQTNHIKPGPSLNGAPGATEMQFQCLGCGHASEMFGFVKEVFKCCAENWGLDALVKELDCVKMIFRGSKDLKGKELRNKAEEMLYKLDKQLISRSDACENILAFFNGSISEFSNHSSKDLVLTRQGGADVSVQTSCLTPQGPAYNLKDSSGIGREDEHRNSLQNGDRVLNGSKTKLQNNEFDSLEGIVRIKEAEARMFQSRADDARREAEGLHQIARVKNQKLEEEYACKLARLCLQETEERRRKKVEELKVLETSHCDYYSMKTRMEAEIAGLLQRMEATKQQLV